MPGKKGSKKNTNPSNGAAVDPTLTDVARTIGSTLGTAAAKAEDAAREIETFSRAVSKRTAAATRKFYKRAKKSLRAGTASWKSKAKKRKVQKKRPAKKSVKAK